MSDTVKKVFGGDLRSHRTNLESTQQDVALSCDMSVRFYQYLEGGTRTPSLITIFRLADALDTTPDELIEKSWKVWKKENRKRRK